ncbi:tyrosine recombinase XerC [Kitasatospora herbaricolor]|uniref:site-specific integrase n=1 Tax=Kitasatospora herbaricolor TaxID=68217 RepID=UPI0036D938D1
MRSTSPRGRVYRRCGCRDSQHKQLGARCPELAADRHHGTWTYAVDSHSFPDHRRHTVRRGGFPKKKAAKKALHQYLTSERLGYHDDPDQTLAEYLTDWLAAKEMQLKPTTLARYRAYVLDDLIPHLGFIPVDDLNHHHIKAYALTQLGRGRGKVTVYRILSTLSSALGDARRDHRLRRNAALPMVFPRPRAADRTIWTAGQAAQFLRYCHHADPLMADLCEVLIGTGMRKGEALGLHWQDVHLAARLLFIRWTLSAVDNNHLVLNAPKTRASKAWVALSDRVAHALAHRAAPATFRSTRDQDQPADGLVFTRNGRRLHPQYVLNRFHALCREAGVPKIALHDLRHLAVTLAMDAGTEMAVVSKTVRHSTFSTTVNLYHHLRGKAARGAVDGIARLLDHADQDAYRGINHPHRKGPRHPRLSIRPTTPRTLTAVA